MLPVFLIIFFLIICALGCESIPISQKSDPIIIIIRNNTNEYLKEVSLSENRNRDTGNIKMGSISPVPNGVSQIFGRSSRPSKLPRQINVCCINNADKEFCKLVSLKSVLKGANTLSGEALVFEILPFSEVTVYLENIR